MLSYLLYPLLRSLSFLSNLAEEASELRLLLCKKKEEGQTQSNVLSAAGIYVKDILRAAPIVKYFDLYKSVSNAPTTT